MFIEAALSNRWWSMPWAAWWGYAEADSTLVGVLVVAIALLAVVYVLMRLMSDRGPWRGPWRGLRRGPRRGPRSRSGKPSGSRG